MTDPKKPAPDEDDDEPSKVTINVDVNEETEVPKQTPPERETVERTITEHKTTDSQR